MRIGHVDLSAHIAVAEEQLVVLVEALSTHGVKQHVLVRNPFLAKRLSVCAGVSVGPVVRSPVRACFLVPAVDLMHAHERKAVTTAMLLNMTRSVPYILTHRQFRMPGNSPVKRLPYRRSAEIVCPSEDIANAMLDYVSDKPVDTIRDARNIDDEIDAKNGRISAAKMAADYMRVYRRTLDSRSVPAILI
jgi:hypothetical protein